MNQRQFCFDGQNSPTTPATPNHFAVAEHLRRKRVSPDASLESLERFVKTQEFPFMR